MIGRRNLPNPSVNLTFNALLNGVQYTLLIHWANFVLKCIFPNIIFFFLMICSTVIFIDSEDALLYERYFTIVIILSLSLLTWILFDPYLVKLLLLNIYFLEPKQTFEYSIFNIELISSTNNYFHHSFVTHIYEDIFWLLMFGNSLILSFDNDKLVHLNDLLCL